jgi:hypothetical protein
MRRQSMAFNALQVTDQVRTVLRSGVRDGLIECGEKLGRDRDARRRRADSAPSDRRRLSNAFVAARRSCS